MPELQYAAKGAGFVSGDKLHAVRWQVSLLRYKGVGFIPARRSGDRFAFSMGVLAIWADGEGDSRIHSGESGGYCDGCRFEVHADSEQGVAVLLPILLILVLLFPEGPLWHHLLGALLGEGFLSPLFC